MAELTCRPRCLAEIKYHLEEVQPFTVEIYRSFYFVYALDDNGFLLNKIIGLFFEKAVINFEP